MATTFFSFLKQHRIPRRATLQQSLERPLSWYGLGLYALIGALLVTTYVMIIVINHRFTVAIPARGGTLVEGVIGAPHVINPVLASTETDRDLVSLIYSGLMRAQPDGTIAPDLAQSYTVSPNGLVYTFTLHDKLTWSDGKPLTANDVAFTVSKLANPILHSDPYWQDVTVSTPDTHTVVYTLSQPRDDLLAYATVGILPQHIWQDVVDEAFDTAPQNLHPVGSGPYRYASIRLTNGVATKITLQKNNHAIPPPFIGTYVVDFFANQNDLLSALNHGSIDMTLAADPTTASNVTNSDDYVFDKIESPNTVALFQLRNAVLLGGAFADTINQSIDKRAILAIVEHGYGILPSMSSDAPSRTPADTLSALQSLGYTYTNGVLQKNGIAITFAAAVENDPTLLLAARTLSDQLVTIGITMTIKAFDPGMFADVVNTNQYQFFVGNVRDIPNGYSTLFTLYTPATPFIHKQSTHISIPEYLDSPDERYLQLAEWHIRTNDVWKPFAKKYQNTSTNNN